MWFEREAADGEGGAFIASVVGGPETSRQVTPRPQAPVFFIILPTRPTSKSKPGTGQAKKDLISVRELDIL
jgi:hypothetical protein